MQLRVALSHADLVEKQAGKMPLSGVVSLEAKLVTGALLEDSTGLKSVAAESGSSFICILFSFLSGDCAPGIVYVPHWYFASPDGALPPAGVTKAVMLQLFSFTSLLNTLSRSAADLATWKMSPFVDSVRGWCSSANTSSSSRWRYSLGSDCLARSTKSPRLADLTGDGSSSNDLYDCKEGIEARMP